MGIYLITLLVLVAGFIYYICISFKKFIPLSKRLLSIKENDKFNDIVKLIGEPDKLEDNKDIVTATYILNVEEKVIINDEEIHQVIINFNKDKTVINISFKK